MAEDGVEAVEAVERERFDLILMDIQMPRMDGITAVARIRDREQAAGRPPAPIIMLTANTQAEHVAACREAGANRHLGKPSPPPGCSAKSRPSWVTDGNARHRGRNLGLSPRA